ncbi:MAG: PDZ domain-containing protein [Planctomycetota bacterium]|nr:PDZ domain-containing protein [Planctomycetota bacterium]
MSGYFRFPTIHEDNVVFVSEDDLWTVPVTGGMARRLTSNLGSVSNPCFSPDGEYLAFTGRDEGPAEVYCMPAIGGEARRLTWQGSNAMVTGWTPKGEIVYSNNSHTAFAREKTLWSVGLDGGPPESFDCGPGSHISFGPNKGQAVIGRNTEEPARWKRYRGGMSGSLWVDAEGNGEFKLLEPIGGNITAPLWIGDRIYFISDHQGFGNLYSCFIDGTDIKRHSHQDEYYARTPKTDGKRIVYHAGSDLFVYDIALDTNKKIEVEYHSPRVQRNRKFADPYYYLDSYNLHPDGHALAMTVRGQMFSMANWEGGVLQHGESGPVRHRLADWLKDGERLIVVSDASGEDAFEIHQRDGRADLIRMEKYDIGRPVQVAVSPKKDEVVFTNHRHELHYINIKRQTFYLLDRCEQDWIRDVSWSSDGRWIAYSYPTTDYKSRIKVMNVQTAESWFVTSDEFRDFRPAWDPAGKFLYFLSNRDFRAVADRHHFELSFPQATRPYLLTLQKDEPNPFVPLPRPFHEDDDEDEDYDEDDDKDKKEDVKVEIDLDGIEGRVVAFPFDEGNYGQIAGIRGKVLLTSFPMIGYRDAGSQTSGILYSYELKEQKKETLITGISHFRLSMDRKTMIYRKGENLRVLKSGEKPSDKEDDEGFTRKNGWIDLMRVNVSISPRDEWLQMYNEAWRLQRDHFWTEDMSSVDWHKVYHRYLPLLKRVSTRTEFSDLMWEMQGELGTSHCYEIGGSYRWHPYYSQGFLGADIQWDARSKGYRIVHIIKGDCWDQDTDSPFNKPGINVKEGDVILTVSGQKVTRECSPNKLLVFFAGEEVELLIRSGRKKRNVTVRTLHNERQARYREWVTKNREYVHKKSKGKIGYVHIPNMGGDGYAEFHRGFLAEIEYDGLLIDVRTNGGGFVSQLILEKLARKRIGYDVRRWGPPFTYPENSPNGPLIALTNEAAGSDGDIFSHAFKLMKLGKLVGKRTWGGVIGIMPRQPLVDGTITTQPEYSYWFNDVGWKVENYGTDPDIEVDYPPQDYKAGKDPQLDRTIEELMKDLKENPPKLPDFGDRPKLTLPALPAN